MCARGVFLRKTHVIDRPLARRASETSCEMSKRVAVSQGILKVRDGLVPEGDGRVGAGGDVGFDPCTRSRPLELGWVSKGKEPLDAKNHALGQVAEIFVCDQIFALTVDRLDGLTRQKHCATPWRFSAYRRFLVRSDASVRRLKDCGGRKR